MKQASVNANAFIIARRTFSVPLLLYIPVTNQNALFSRLLGHQGKAQYDDFSRDSLRDSSIDID
jgi:hypothetical protein